MRGRSELGVHVCTVNTVHVQPIKHSAFKLVRFDCQGKPIERPRVVVNVDMVVKMMLEKTRDMSDVSTYIQKKLVHGWKRLLPPKHVQESRSRGNKQKHSFVYLRSVIEYVERTEEFGSLSIKEDLQNKFKEDLVSDRLKKCELQIQKLGHPFVIGDFVKTESRQFSGKIESVLQDGTLGVRWQMEEGRFATCITKMHYVNLLYDRDTQIYKGMEVQAMSSAKNLRKSVGLSVEGGNHRTMEDLLLLTSTVRLVSKQCRCVCCAPRCCTA